MPSFLDPSCIPQELKDRHQWVLWKAEPRPNSDKPTKVPYQPNGKKASTTNPTTWSSFQSVTAVARNYSGIGFVFSEDDDYVGIDIDHCVDPDTGELSRTARQWVEKSNSYTEYSPSGTGIHTIIKGKLVKPIKTDGFEIYSAKRYFTVTGDNYWDQSVGIEYRQEVLDKLVSWLTGDDEPQPVGEDTFAHLQEMTDDEVIERAKTARNQEKFCDLFYHGNFLKYYGSQSEGDLALIGILYFWTQDSNQIDRIFRKSKLYREKWEREEYRRDTIERVRISRLETSRGTTPTPTVTNSSYPPLISPYYIDEKHHLCYRDDNPQGENEVIQIYDFPIYITERFNPDLDKQDEGQSNTTEVQMSVHWPNDGYKTYMTPISKILNPDSKRFTTALHELGLTVDRTAVEYLPIFFKDSIDNLINTRKADKYACQFGWSPDGESFVNGRTRYTVDGPKPAQLRSVLRPMAARFDSVGTLEEWRRVAEVYLHKRMTPFQFILAVGFGAALIRLYGDEQIHGCTLFISSDKSGPGKSTACSVVQSIFGSPRGGTIRDNASYKATVDFISSHSCLPVTYDEMRLSKASTNGRMLTSETLAALIRDVSAGQSRRILNKDRTPVPDLQFSSFLLVTSNEFIKDQLINSGSCRDAELQRMHQIYLDEKDLYKLSEATASELFGEVLSQNYGVAAPIYLDYIVKNRNLVTALLKKTKTELYKDFDLQIKNRFLTMMLSCALTGAKIAKYLGILNFNVSQIRDWAATAILEHKADEKEMDDRSNPIDCLRQLIHEGMAETLIIQSSRSAAIQEPLTRIVNVRFELDSKMLYLSQEWVKKRLMVGNRMEYKVLKDALGTLANEGQFKTSFKKSMYAGYLPGDFLSYTWRLDLNAFPELWKEIG